MIALLSLYLAALTAYRTYVIWKLQPIDYRAFAILGAWGFATLSSVLIFILSFYH